MSELPDFTTAPAWMDALGGVVAQRQVMDYRGPLGDFSAGAPWTPLDTADEWVQRIDRGKLADVIELAILGRQMSAPRTAKLTAHAVLAALPELMEWICSVGDEAERAAIADAELIAAAPTLLAELADEVERLTPVCSGCLYEPEAECPVHGYSRAELWAEFERLTSENGDLFDYACVCVGGEWDLTCPVHTDGEDVISASERISVLTDEVERLRALTTVDDAMVERGARAVYGAASADATGWDMANQSMRDTCRTLSNAAIDAALGVES